MKYIVAHAALIWQSIVFSALSGRWKPLFNLLFGLFSGWTQTISFLVPFNLLIIQGIKGYTILTQQFMDFPCNLTSSLCDLWYEWMVLHLLLLFSYVHFHHFVFFPNSFDGSEIQIPPIVYVLNYNASYMLCPWHAMANKVKGVLQNLAYVNKI